MAITNTVSSVTTQIRGLINDQIQNDGRNAYEFDTDNKFRLSEPFIQSSSIIVYQNGVAISTDDWSYNADTNEVTIVFVTSGGVLTADDIIVITYNYYKQYSDTEISGFLTSSFSYFVQHRYRKTFVIDSNSNINAENNTIPTTNELYFIAIIASILIDPQNINIKTSAFSLTAKRDMSDQDQISKAFSHFKRFVGILTFEEGHELL